MNKILIVLFLLYTSASSNVDQSTSDPCRAPKDAYLCSGRGKCISDVCECDVSYSPDEKFYGRYCECENFSCSRINGLLCSGPDHGACECGKCVCKPNWGGLACSSTTLTDSCRPSKDSPICSNRGNCYDGKCHCNQRSTFNEKIYGKYCECDDYSCYRYNRKMCGGHGTCECGSCSCEEGWTGSACQCSTSTATCQSSEETQLCSGHGECKCGKCVCESGWNGETCSTNVASSS